MDDLVPNQTAWKMNASEADKAGNNESPSRPEILGRAALNWAEGFFQIVF